jgi:hypothetical protein
MLNEDKDWLAVQDESRQPLEQNSVANDQSGM